MSEFLQPDEGQNNALEKVRAYDAFALVSMFEVQHATLAKQRQPFMTYAKTL